MSKVRYLECHPVCLSCGRVSHGRVIDGNGKSYGPACQDCWQQIAVDSYEDTSKAIVIERNADGGRLLVT